MKPSWDPLHFLEKGRGERGGRKKEEGKENQPLLNPFLDLPLSARAQQKTQEEAAQHEQQDKTV